MSMSRPKYGTNFFLGMNTIDSAFQGWGINDWSDIQLPGEDDVRGSLEKRKLNFLPSFGIFNSVSPLYSLTQLHPQI